MRLVIRHLSLVIGHCVAGGLALTPPVLAQGGKLPPIYRKAVQFYRERGKELGRKYELKESAEAPAWAADEADPLFRFVHITDVHYHPRLRKLLLEALHYISNKVRPAFVVMTGDNAGSARLVRQRAFKRMLDGSLHVPCFILRGDNWPQGFTEVFGDPNWSFVCGGVGFVGASLDRDAINLGIGVLSETTFTWIRERLDAHADRPVLYFQHVNVMPPTFLDAPKLLTELQSRRNVVATVTGHLHRDYETRLRGIVHVIGPGFGPHDEHGFKVFNVHADHITVRTIKWRGGKFQYVTLYQRIDFPGHLQLKPPVDVGRRAEWLGIAGYCAPAAREVVLDSALAGRMLELIPPLLSFIPLTGRAQEIWADLGDLTADITQAMAGE